MRAEDADIRGDIIFKNKGKWVATGLYSSTGHLVSNVAS